MGSGLEMALLCDVRVAANNTVLGLPETKLGMLPAAGGTQSLTRILGPHAASPLILTGRDIEASEALDLGIVTELVDPAELDQVSERTAHQLALIDPAIAMKLRRCLAAANDLPLSLGLELERQLAITK
jgi:enoyl-CoA hydratase/carnithine racemase